jgi:hypothetical protein
MGPKGDRWNESDCFPDRITGRPVRRITSGGTFNEKRTYHTNTTFTADGKTVVFATARDGMSALCRCDVETGDIVKLTRSVPGILGWAHCNKADGGSPAQGTGITGTTVCLAPRTRWAVYFAGRSLEAVHLDTLEGRVLIADIGPEWIEGAISIGPTERFVLIPLMPALPDPASRSYLAAFASGGMRTRYVQAPLAGGATTDVFEDLGVGYAHCPHCPGDPDLVLIDRDLPPLYWCGGDQGLTNRCWLLRLSTGRLTPLIPRDAQRFQVHACWSWDGSYVFHHGWRREGGWYIGVCDVSGRTLREHNFPDAKGYGHVAAAAHDTEWDSVPGQCADPHPTADPTGRWVCYNSARGGRSDVYVVGIGER